MDAMNRLALKAILLSAILILCFYSQHGYRKLHSSIPQVKEDPERYENVSFRSEGRAKNVRLGEAETTLTLIVMGDEIEVLYPKPIGLKEGDYVIVYGILQMKKGYLLATQLHIYKDIRRLYVLSFVGLILLLFLFLRDWRPTQNGFEWRSDGA